MDEVTVFDGIMICYSMTQRNSLVMWPDCVQKGCYEAISRIPDRRGAFASASKIPECRDLGGVSRTTIAAKDQTVECSISACEAWWLPL